MARQMTFLQAVEKYRRKEKSPQEIFSAEIEARGRNPDENVPVSFFSVVYEEQGQPKTAYFDVEGIRNLGQEVGILALKAGVILLFQNTLHPSTGRNEDEELGLACLEQLIRLHSRKYVRVIQR
jgi:hypothetical protein